jgi:hypothetical protein
MSLVKSVGYCVSGEFNSCWIAVSTPGVLANADPRSPIVSRLKYISPRLKQYRDAGRCRPAQAVHFKF